MYVRLTTTREDIRARTIATITKYDAEAKAHVLPRVQRTRIRRNIDGRSKQTETINQWGGGGCVLVVGNI
jgi:hypothetical protein